MGGGNAHTGRQAPSAISEPDKWDRRFMLLAHHLAGWSKEPGRRVGAVIVGPDNIVRATGYNGFARGVNDEDPARRDRASGEKYFWSCHAERNAIYNAARIGVALAGCRIYVPWYPCGECAKAIVQAGIVEVIAYEPDPDDPRWGAETPKVATMLAEAGLRVRLIARLAQTARGEDD